MPLGSRKHFELLAANALYHRWLCLPDVADGLAMTSYD